MSDGTYSNCTITVTDSAGNASNTLVITSFIADSTAATLEEVTVVTTPTNDNTPDYTFSSSEAGTITYGGSCSSSTTSATTDNNTVTFNTLSDGTYSNCTITVTDNGSNNVTLNISSFIIDTTAPTIAEVSAVQTPSGDNTSSYTFSSDEAGTITYGGSCSSTTTAATADNNTITFNALAVGTYNDCTLTVKDNTNNVSDNLSITSFTIVVDTSTPTVLYVTSDNTSGEYTTGTLNIIVKFSETVYVNTSSGSPRLLLETGDNDTYATYVSGSNTDNLTFSYTIQDNHTSSSDISVKSYLNYDNSSTLELNSSTIKDTVNNAVVTLPATTDNNSLANKKQITIPYCKGDCSWISVGTTNAWSGQNQGAALAVYNDKLWVLGGDTGGGYPKDVWYTDNGSTWTRATNNAGWSGRGWHDVLVFENKMWLFAGISSFINGQDAWYSSDGENWTEASSNAGYSNSGGKQNFIIFNNKLWKVGGHATNTIYFSDNGSNWTNANVSDHFLKGVGRTVFVFDNKIWSMGGNEYDENNNANPADGGLSTVWYSEGWNVLEEQGSELARFYPGLEAIQIAHYIAGPSTYTPDGQFVLGSVPDIDGFLVATGCCGSGIGASGGVGSAIADLAIEGRTKFDLESFRTDRFGRIDAFSSEWMQRCANARSKKS